MVYFQGCCCFLLFFKYGTSFQVKFTLINDESCWLSLVNWQIVNWWIPFLSEEFLWIAKQHPTYYLQLPETSNSPLKMFDPWKFGDFEHWKPIPFLGGFYRLAAGLLVSAEGLIGYVTTLLVTDWLSWTVSTAVLTWTPEKNQRSYRYWPLRGS